MGLTESMLIGMGTALLTNVVLTILYRRFGRKVQVVPAALAKECLEAAKETQEIAKVLLEAYEEAREELAKK